MDENKGTKRVYDNSLRLQQQEMTHDSIMSAVEALILDGRFHNFTIQEVADQAGVSYGTVYRHFSSREALLEGYIPWAARHVEKMHPPYPDRLEDFPRWVEQTVPLVMPLFPMMQVMETVVSAVYRKEIPAPSRHRDERFARLVAQIAPELSDTQIKASTALLRHFGSIRMWMELHTRYGLDQQQLTLALTEGINAQISQLKMRVEEARKG